MDRSVEFYFLNGLSASTRKSYDAAKNRYKTFCEASNTQPLPLSEAALCQFVSHLANDNLCHSTIKCYLSAVRHLSIAEGHGDPGISSMVRLEQVVKGIKAVQAKAPPSRPTRLPITPELLRKMKQSWSRADKWNGTMLWAASTLCFFGFFRSGEITVGGSEASFDSGVHLTFNDVTVDSLENPQMLKVRLKASKTDPFRVGIDIYVGRTKNDLCPVAAVLAYMALRGQGPGPLFTFKDGKPLTRARLVAEVKQALATAGVDCSHYSGHSFRSGAATTAARQGIGDATIKMLGRWKSNAYQLYVKTPREELAAFSQRLCKNSTTRAE